MTELIRRFSRKRDMSSSRIHCCYIIIGTEIKDKHILEKMSCSIVQSSALGLKKKKMYFFPPWELQTLLSSLGTPDFLSTYLGTDSLIPLFLGELYCQGKGALFPFHNYFLLLRGIVPKLLRQCIFLTSTLRVSNPGAPSNSWGSLWHLQEPGQPFLP